jgi:hypothetical protein
MITLMALSLCVGLLIDDAIVVRENIVRHVQMGKNAYQASLEGTQEIALAVLATTFSIVAVFLPIGFMGGIIGKFFHEFGITIVAAVLISMFVSFTLDPMLSSIWHDPAIDAHGKPPGSSLYDRSIGRVTGWFDRATDRLADGYQALLRWSLAHKLATLLMALAVKAQYRLRLWTSAGFSPDGIGSLLPSQRVCLNGGDKLIHREGSPAAGLLHKLCVIHSCHRCSASWTEARLHGSAKAVGTRTTGKGSRTSAAGHRGAAERKGLARTSLDTYTRSWCGCSGSRRRRCRRPLPISARSCRCGYVKSGHARTACSGTEDFYVLLVERCGLRPGCPGGCVCCSAATFGLLAVLDLELLVLRTEVHLLTR